jgi:hypothetical protein
MLRLYPVLGRLQRVERFWLKERRACRGGVLFDGNRRQSRFRTPSGPLEVEAAMA